MARSSTSRTVPNVLRQTLLPGQKSEEAMLFFGKPTGENHVTPLTELGLDYSPFVQNLVFNPVGKYRTRSGTQYTGVAAADQIAGLAIFSSRTSSDYIIRVTLTGVEVWGGSSWSALTGPVLSLGIYTQIEFTVWNDKLCFTDGASGMYSINLGDGTYSLIPGAPASLHLTTFGSRIVASYIVKDADPATGGTLPTRIEWCVKNDNTDWLGLGSGYEDLLSSPGGTVDVQHGVIPVTDVEAFVIRSSSIWIMTTTGYFDTPFQFTYRFDQGTDSPGSIVRCPTGRGENSTTRSMFAQILLLSTDDVIEVRPEGVTPVGFPIKDQLLNGTLNPRRAIAGFEPRNREYWIHVPPLNSNNTTSVVWKYRIDEKTWYHSLYPFKLTHMAFKDILLAQTFDQLTGTFDELVGSFDDLGLGTRVVGPVMATIDDNYIIHEQEGVVGDVDSHGNSLGIPIEIQTGMIMPADPRENMELIKVEILYEASQAVVAILEYTEDAGVTWQAYGTINLLPTTAPTILPYRATRFLEKCQLRLRSDDGSTLKLHGIFVKTVKGSAIYQ